MRVFVKILYNPSREDSMVQQSRGTSRQRSGKGAIRKRFYDGPDLKLFILVGWGRSFLSVAWPTGVQLVFFFCSGVSRLFGAQGSPSSAYSAYDMFHGIST